MKDIVLQAFEESTRVKEHFAKENADILVAAVGQTLMIKKDWIKDGAVFGQAWEGWHMLILAAQQTPDEYLGYLRRETIPYLVAGEKGVDLRLALEKLGAKLGVTTVLSTAGGRLSGALLRAGLVDEINVEFLPGLIGGPDTPSLFDSPTLGPDERPTRLDLISAHVQAGGQVWLRYRVISE